MHRYCHGDDAGDGAAGCTFDWPDEDDWKYFFVNGKKLSKSEYALILEQIKGLSIEGREKDPEDAIPVVIVPLSFQVFVKTSDGELTLKAAFATGNLAGAWMIGLATQKVECKIFEERKGELYEVTDQVVLEAAKAIKEASQSGQA